MLKFCKAVLLIAAALLILPLTAKHDVYGATFQNARSPRVILDRQLLELSCEPAIIESEVYLPVRAVCETLGGGIRWNAERGEAVAIYKGVHLINGVIVNDKLMVSQETVRSVFKVSVVYYPELSVVSIDHGAAPTTRQLREILPKHAGYDNEDLYWLSRIVEAEAKGEAYTSRLAVANVILNRMSSPAYPDSIYDVIFDKKHGVQFSPVSNGSIYNEPSETSRLAAIDALEGRNNAPGALFFMNPKYATSFWMQNNREYAFTIGAHNYYY